MASLLRSRILRGVAALLLARCAIAASTVSLDGTAGPAKTFTGQNIFIDAADGRQVGKALFQSFSQLSLCSGDSLTFTGPASTTTIIARVTGGSPSLINGTIATQGMDNAHLFLINPAGITFGPDASVSSLKQSFTATTADTVRLSDGTVFNSRGPLPAQLTCAPPAAFGFTSPHQGTIAVKGTVLTLDSGKSLALIAGSVQITDEAKVRVNNGRVQLVAVGDSGTATVDAFDAPAQGAAPTLDAPASNGLLFVDAASRVSADGGAGRVDLLGQQITINGLVTSQSQGPTQGARIDVFSVGDCVIDGGGVRTHTRDDTAAGPVTFQVNGTLTVERGADISADTAASGSGGQITLAAPRIIIDGGSVHAQSGLPGVPGTGPGGNVDLHTQTLVVERSGSVSTSTTDSDFNAGNITIHADSISLASGGRFIAQGGGDGTGGIINVQADAILIVGRRGPDPTGILADTTATSAGTGGQITLCCATLDVQHLGVVSATSHGTGAGGNIDITAHAVRLDGSGLRGFTGIGANAQSPTSSAGDVNVHAADVQVLDGAGIVATTYGSGRGGNITLDGVRRLRLDGADNPLVDTGIFVKSFGGSAAGNAGNILIAADAVSITRGASINAASAGTANGGNVTLRGKSIVLNRGTVEADAAGDGGSVEFDYSRWIALNTALVSARAEGNGGNIILDPVYTVLRSSTLRADAVNGDGGSIFLYTSWYIPADTAFHVSSVFGAPGSITIQTSNILTPPPASPLPVVLPGAEGLLLDPCEVRFRDSASSLLVTPSYNPSALPPLWLPAQSLMGGDGAGGALP